MWPHMKQKSALSSSFSLSLLVCLCTINYPRHSSTQIDSRDAWMSGNCVKPIFLLLQQITVHYVSHACPAYISALVCVCVCVCAAAALCVSGFCHAIKCPNCPSVAMWGRRGRGRGGGWGWSCCNAFSCDSHRPQGFKQLTRLSTLPAKNDPTLPRRVFCQCNITVLKAGCIWTEESLMTLNSSSGKWLCHSFNSGANYVKS